LKVIKAVIIVMQVVTFCAFHWVKEN